MKISILGFGTVGKGVYDMLTALSEYETGPVLVLPEFKDADFKVTDLRMITEDPTVDVVVETMGGISPAFEFCKEALLHGKHVVTSNKAMVVAKGLELQKVAEENHVGFLFSAACGGAMPYLSTLDVAARTDEITYVGGILNGTTNFMLSAMQQDFVDYDEILKKAQELGYAEKDPTADVSGMDSLRKIILASAIAFNKMPVAGMLNEGIESITVADIKHFRSLGLTCRLLTEAVPTENGVAAYVEPMLFPENSLVASVQKNFNLSIYVGKNVDRIEICGQGAGRYPTASSVVRDIAALKTGSRYMFREGLEEVTADCSGRLKSYYVRCEEKNVLLFAPEEVYEQGENWVIKTKPLAVSEMHAKAAEVRKAGGKLFFAGLEA